MSLINDGKIIAYPVSIADIQSKVPVTIQRTVNGVTESRSSSDLGVLCGGYVGKSVPDNAGGTAWQVKSRIDINMWAKWKPVRFNLINTMEQLDPDPERAANKLWRYENSDYFKYGNARPWWESDNGNYGLDYTNAVINGLSIYTGDATHISGMEDALGDLADKIDGKLNGWAYNQPRGRSYSEPYRQIDFNRYNHKAPNPVNVVSVRDVIGSSDSIFYVAANPQEPEGVNNPIWQRDFITPRDVKWITIGGNAEEMTLHMGFAIFKDDAPIAWVTGSATWVGWGINNADAIENGVTGRGNDGVRMKLVNRGEYKILPFYSTESLPQPDPNTKKNMSKLPERSATRLFTVPYTDFVPFTVSQAKTEQTIAWGYCSPSTADRMNSLTTTFYLDSRGGWYVGSSIPFSVEIVLTKYSSYQQYENAGKPIPSDALEAPVRYANTITLNSLADEAVVPIAGPITKGLSFGETWYCYVTIHSDHMKTTIPTMVNPNV